MPRSSSVAVRAEEALEPVRFSTETLLIPTGPGQELYNLTDRLAEIIKRLGIREGIAIVSSMHTTLALFVNEWQEALLHDVKAMLRELVVPGKGYRHDDPRYSDCDRKNAHAHLQATLLGHTLALPVARGRLVLGQFQSIIAAELDGPRTRELTVQVVGR